MSKRAWVTLATNDSYGLGALVMAHSLRRAGSVYPAVVLITPSVTQTMRDRLSAVFAEVIMVNVLDSQDAAHLALLQRPELGITFTKIHCWNLSQYEKCVFLDADTLVIQNSDELFEREELSAAPDVGWPDCFNSGVFVFSPSPETFEKLIKFAQERGSFDGGDQGLLNSFFSDWAHGDINKHLPFVYNVTSAAFYSYLPALKHYGQNLKIIHFIGAAKPWLQQYNWESGSVDAPEHLREFLQLWWDLFVANVHAQLDITMSGVAGNLARVVPGTAGCQREALDELNRRQGWEAGNIDYMGADSFENIWAKISQTLSQPRSSPPKQSPPREATPPQKQPSPPPKQSPFRETTSPQKQPLPVKDQSESQTEITGSEVKQETVSESIEVAQEALTIDAPVVQDESVAAKISSSEEEPKAQEISLPVKAETPAELPTPKEVSIPEAHPIPEVVPTSENPITGKNVALVETSAPEQIEPTVGAAVSKEVLQGKSSSIVESSVHETISAEVEPTPVKDAATVEADILTAITDSPAIVDLTVLKESPALVKAPETIAVEAPVLLEATVPVEKTSKTVVESSVVKEKVACVAKAAAPSEDSTKVTPNPTVEDPVLVPSGTSDSIPSQVLPSPVEHDIPKTVANVETEIATQSPSSVLSKDLEKLKKDPVLQKTDKTEKTPPATPKSTPEATTPITESTIKADPLAAVQIAAASTGSLESQKVIGTPVVVPASPISTDIPASTVPEPKATPEKPLNVKTATDSPPLANTPSKEEAPALPVAKSEERRKPVGKLHLSPPVVADPLPTPDSELEDAATLAQSIIASELKTPTVSSPSPSTVPISPMPPKQEKRLSVEEPEVPTPPVGAVSLAQIGVKPSKGKPNTAALIESSVTEKSDPVQRDNNAPVSPTKTSEPTTDVKKKAVKKSAKESSSSEAPVPPPRKKEKKPKDK